MRQIRTLTILVAAAAITGVASTGRALTPDGAPAQATDLSVRLKAVLPADVAARVLAVIADARARDLPAEALEQRALKFAAKGVAAPAIERSIAEQAQRMVRARDVLSRARGTRPLHDEVEAGAEALRMGVDGARVGELAQGAPSGRSLVVPLYVIGSLVERGLPSDHALDRVRERLQARATDAELERLSKEPNVPPHATAPPGHANRPAETGRDLAATKRPGSAGGGNGQGNGAGGPPAGVPGNAGKNARPTTPPGLDNKPNKPDKPDKPGKPAKPDKP
jgi:hypothetical protein